MGMDRTLQKKKWPPKKIALWGSVALFVILVLYILIFQVRKSTLNVKAERLTISEVVAGPFQEYTPVIGEIMPINTFFLSADEGGRVEEIFLEAGSMVQKGDKILKMANTSLLLDIMYRQAELSQQSNNLRMARLQMEQNRLSLTGNILDLRRQLQIQKRTVDANEELMKQNLISRLDYETAKEQYEYLIKKVELTEESQKNDAAFRESQILSLEESLRQMQKNFAFANQKLEDLTVRAPVSGHLTTLDAEIGQSKSAGQRLGQIDILDGFKIRAEIDEFYLGRVDTGKTGNFDLQGQAYTLRVKKIYPEVKDRKFQVDMEFTNTVPKEITRGQTIHIQLNLSDLTEAVLLPRGGFFQTTGGNWVFVLDPSGKTAQRRAIVLGRANTDVHEVKSGLKPGDRVITSSYENFGDNERLVLKE